MNQKKKRLSCPDSTVTPVPTPDGNSAPSMSGKELEELRYNTAVALLKAMSPGSVFQFAVDKQLQLLDAYSPEELQHLAAQYKLYAPTTKEKGGEGF